MDNLRYTVIKNDSQYYKYCNRLEILIDGGRKSQYVQEQIEILELLIEHYDNKHNTFDEVSPIDLLKGLMTDHKLKSNDIAKLLQVSEGLVSDILHGKKGLSKETIRILSNHFKLRQEAFNRPYPLKSLPTSKKSTVLTKKLKSKLAIAN